MFGHHPPGVLGAFVMLFALYGGRVEAEVPLPNAVVFGTLSSGGLRLSSGDLIAVVHRDGREVLRVPASFVDSGGVPLFVIRIPLQTSSGAPGENGSAARPGDVVSQLLLGGEEVAPRTRFPTLTMGLLMRVEAEVPGGATERLFRGDCNGDLQSDVSDAVSTLVFLFLATKPPPCLKACDANGDRALNLTDAVFLLTHLFSGGPAPPPPSGSCGVDQSPPDLSCEERTCLGGA